MLCWVLLTWLAGGRPQEKTVKDWPFLEASGEGISDWGASGGTSSVAVTGPWVPLLAGLPHTTIARRGVVKPARASRVMATAVVPSSRGSKSRTPTTTSALPIRSICSRSGCERESSSTHVLRLPAEATRCPSRARAPKRGGYSTRRTAHRALYPTEKPRAIFESHRRRRVENPRVRRYRGTPAEIPRPWSGPIAAPRVRDFPNPRGGAWCGRSDRYRRRNPRTGSCRRRPSWGTAWRGAPRGDAQVRPRSRGSQSRSSPAAPAQDDNPRESECAGQERRLRPRA